MSAPSIDWLALHRRWRRPFEIGFWAVVLLVQAVFNTIVTWLDLRDAASALPCGSRRLGRRAACW